MGVVATACGSSGGSSSSATTSTPSAAGAHATVAVRGTSIGQVLVDGQGRTLYLLTADKGTTSSCNGGCVAVWPPLTTIGAPAAGAGANASLLGTTTRSGGSKEVTYGGHPLYRYSGDSAAGDANGEGINSFGGRWWALSATGSAVTSGSATTSRPGGY